MNLLDFGGCAAAALGQPRISIIYDMHSNYTDQRFVDAEKWSTLDGSSN